MEIRADHPRIWIDPARLAWMREKVKKKHAIEIEALAGDTGAGLALTSLLTGDGALCLRAFAAPALRHHAELVYDWCYAHLGREQKQILRARIAANIEETMATRRAFRSFHNAGHAAALELTLGILALWGDDPIAARAWDFLRPELDDMLLTLDEVFPDGEWGEGSDYARHASHETFRSLMALKTATGVDLLAGSPHFQHAASFIFYSVKPDYRMFPGDDNDYPFLNGWEHKALLLSAAEFRDPYAQWFLQHSVVEPFVLAHRDRWMDLLWADPSIPERPLSELPLARIFRGKGLVLARSGWDQSESSRTWLAFANGDYFGDHDHLDVNSFQLFHRGDLAIDSGRYDDDWDSVGSPAKVARSQFFNYYQRTIAHNTMLVHDPKEDFGRGYLNDGGQRRMIDNGLHRTVPEDYAQGNYPSDDGVGIHDWTTNLGRWERGDITAYTATSELVFVRGDGTRAYSPHKLGAFVRELVFIRPRLVVVFDRVVATDPSYEKTWLLHTIDEPVLEDATFEVKAGEGRLFGLALLPADRRLRKLGGPHDEFTVAGVKFRAGPASELNPSKLHYGEQPGAWRIEETPGAPRAEDYFANAMLLTARTSPDRPTVLSETNDATAYALELAHDDLRVKLRFAKGATPHTTLAITRGGRTTFDGALPDHVVLEDGRR